MLGIYYDKGDSAKIFIAMQSRNRNVGRVPKILMTRIIIFTSTSKLFTRGNVSLAGNNCVKGKSTEREVKTTSRREVLRTRV